MRKIMYDVSLKWIKRERYWDRYPDSPSVCHEGWHTLSLVSLHARMIRFEYTQERTSLQLGYAHLNRFKTVSTLS